MDSQVTPKKRSEFGVHFWILQKYFNLSFSLWLVPFNFLRPRETKSSGYRPLSHSAHSSPDTCSRLGPWVASPLGLHALGDLEAFDFSPTSQFFFFASDFKSAWASGHVLSWACDFKDAQVGRKFIKRRILVTVGVMFVNEVWHPHPFDFYFQKKKKTKLGSIPTLIF